MNRALDNKSYVIVGGTTGLGLAAAKAFVGEGARVVVVGRNAESLAKAESALGQAACGLAGDATDPQTTVEAINLAKRELGGFDGLYHVAGGAAEAWAMGRCTRSATTAGGRRST